MGRYARWAMVLAAVAVPRTVAGDKPPEPARDNKQTLNNLSLEVAALQTLYALRLTPEQLDKLRKLAKGAADESGARQAAKVSAKYGKALGELREALAQAKDDERIQKLNDQLDKLGESEKPEFDDGVEITDEARDLVPKVVGLLTPAQAAAYLGGVADNIPDPRERLSDALNKVRGLGDKEWKELRDDVASDVSGLVAGLDTDRASRVSEQVVQLLIVARGLKAREYKEQAAALRKKAKAILGDIGPVDVMRHVLEQHMAQLLSNPRLHSALDARAKQAAAK